MSIDKKALIFEYLRKMALVFDQGVTQEKLEIYANALFKFEISELEEAFKRLLYTYDSYKFPTIARITKTILHEKNDLLLATEMSAKIFYLAREHGRRGLVEAKAQISPEENQALELFGGWHYLFEMKVENLETARAQLREICRSVINRQNDHKIDQLFLEQNI